MEIIEKAPAKINLGLNVLGKRADGYHEIDSIMTNIDLSDHILIREIAKPVIKIKSNDLFVPLDEENLVYQAAQLLKDKFNKNVGLEIEIDKKIPIGAGLAGGSSDGAAVLRALNKLWQLNLSQDELANLGAKIGSDVPFCVYGQTAQVSGRGEVVKILPQLPHCWVILTKPYRKISTTKIFRHFKNNRALHPNIATLKDALLQQDIVEIAANMGNSLERTTVAFLPEINVLKSRLLKLGVDGAVMTGSGSAVFGICQNYRQAKRIFNSLKNVNLEMYLVRSL